jgi:ABC-2 type transport system permease protein
MSLSPYLEFTRMTFLQMLAYRLRYYTGVVTYLVFVAGNTALYHAMYAGLPQEKSIGGFSLPEILTYVAISWVGRSLTFNNIDRDMATQVTAGNIGQSLLRPVDYQLMSYFSAIGEMGFRLLLFTVPISLVIFPLFRVGGPASAPAAGWAMASFLLGFFVNTGVNFVVGTMALHLKSIWGVIRAKSIVMELLTGTMVPFSFFPTIFQRIAEALPFQAIGYVPVTIWLGKRSGEELVSSLILQAVWAVAMFLLGAAMWRFGVKRTTIQGG